MPAASGLATWLMVLLRCVRLTSLLLLVPCVDELCGVAFISMPELMALFSGDYASTAFWVFTVPQVVAGVLEPPLMMWAATRPRLRKAFLLGGLLVMGLAYMAIFLIEKPWSFAILCSLAFVGSGVGVNLAQVTLVDSEPERREALMARWTLLGALGDLGTPLLLALLGWFSLGYRYGFLVVGAVTVSLALLLSGQRFAGSGSEDGDADAAGEAPWRALGDWRLVAWLLLACLCSLLDEVFMAFAALHMDGVWQLPLSQRASLLTGFALTGALGLVATEWVLARGISSRSWLMISAVCTAGALLGWLLTARGVAGVAAFLCIGFFAAPLWPLVKAQAFAARPAQSAAVEAAASTLGWVEVVFPLLLGWFADRAGLTVALACLVVQPIAVLIAAFRMPKRSR